MLLCPKIVLVEERKQFELLKFFKERFHLHIFPRKCLKEAAEDDNAPKSTFKVDEIIPIVDSILEQDDKVSINRIHPNHPNC